MKENEKDMLGRKLADLGKRLRHAYTETVPAIWAIVANDLKPLRRIVEQVIQNEKE